MKAIGVDLLMESSNIFSPEDDSSLVNAILAKHNVVVAGKTFDENRSTVECTNRSGEPKGGLR
ncbi:hypothetical protein MASR1M107_21020 [Ignavibacteriales bacterium]